MINMLSFFSLNIKIKTFQPGYPNNSILNLMEQNIMLVPTIVYAMDYMEYVNVYNII